jgi:hypothetical protein
MLQNLLHKQGERNEVQLFRKNSHMQMTLATKIFVLTKKHLVDVGMHIIWKMKLEFPFFIIFRNFHFIFTYVVWCGVFLLPRREVFLRKFTLEPCFWNFWKRTNISSYNNIKVKKKRYFVDNTHTRSSALGDTISDATLLLKDQNILSGSLYSENIQQDTFLDSSMTTSHIPYLAFNPASVTKVCIEDGQKLPSPSKRK